jgi:hypothetical protein
LPPKLLRLRSASSPRPVSPRPRSVSARERALSSPTSVNRPARSGNCVLVCVASSSRRPVTRVSRVLDVSHPTPGCGRYHVLALISKRLGTS